MTNQWWQRRFRAMGSTAHLVGHGGDDGLAVWATREIERLEQLWSRFRPDSELSRVNASAGTPVVVAPETLDLVEHAVAMWALTGGRFDPTVLRALEANGYDETFERVRDRVGNWTLRSAPPGRDALRISIGSGGDAPMRAEPVPSPGCAGIVVDRGGSTVSLPPGVGLDLGGIGKGFAADLVAAGLVARGAHGVCVALGGDVRAAGIGPADGDWNVPVEDPFDETRQWFTYPLGDGAIVTSTRLFRHWIHDGRARHHLIDPATGAPAARGVAAVVVTDAVAWRAESLAKAALIAGPAEGRALLDRLGVEGWIVDDHGDRV